MQAAKQAFQRLPGGIEVRQASKEDTLKLSAAFAVLAGWSLIQVCYVHIVYKNFFYRHYVSSIDTIKDKSLAARICTCTTVYNIKAYLYGLDIKGNADTDSCSQWQI